MMFQHPGIDPFPISVPVAFDETGTPTEFDDRIRINVTAEFFAEHPELEPFRVTPSKLARVFAGDDPSDPEWTVALRFDDEAALMASALADYVST